MTFFVILIPYSKKTRLFSNCTHFLALSVIAQMETIASLKPNWSIALSYSKENLTHLLTELSAKGLHALTRPGHDSSTIYVFVRDCSDAIPQIVKELPYVQSVVALRDNSKLLEAEGLSVKASTMALLPTSEQITKLARVTGSPASAMYFAYARNYTRWLMLLSLIGASFRLFSKQAPWEFNTNYSIIALLWAITFVSIWVGKLEPLYAKKYSYSKPFTVTTSSQRLVFIKKLCFIPVALQFAACLICFQFFCFVLEIFITQIYQGPLGSILALLPTALICSYVPILTIFYDKVIDKLVSWEKSVDPKQSKIEKKFVFTFLTSYVPLLITLFVYLPLGYHLNSQLTYVADLCSRYNIPVIQSAFKIDIKRYQNQFFYFVVTNQVIALGVENVLPFVLDKVLPMIKGENKETSAFKQAEKKMVKDYPEDIELWKQVRNYNLSPWGIFDPEVMVSKMIVQFGYVAMFSTIWPLAPLFCVIFNIIGIKCDFWRCLNKCKPTRIPSDALNKPVQSTQSGSNISSNNMAPWDTILKFVLWVSSLVSPALVIMYNTSNFGGSGLANCLEKRENWFLSSPVNYDWKFIGIFAFASEHFAIFLYIVITKVTKQTQGDKKDSYVPAKTLQEPPHVDLEKVMKESEQFMENKNSQLNLTSKAGNFDAGKLTEKRQTMTSKDPLGKSEKSNGIQPSEAAHMAPITKTATSSNSSATSESNSNKGPQTAKPFNSALSLSSSVAGATVPETIPTSKNYHLRYDKSGNPVSSNSQSMVDIEKKESVESKLEQSYSTNKDSKGPNDEQTEPMSGTKNDIERDTNMPQTATQPSEKVDIGKQFVPESIRDTSKTHLVTIANHDQKSISEAPKVDATPTKRIQQEPPITSADNHQNSVRRTEGFHRHSIDVANHTADTSRHSSLASRKSSDETRSIKKKKKGVLSPLSKLKKKFP